MLPTYKGSKVDPLSTIRMNKPVWQFKAKPFTTNYTNQVPHVFKAIFLQSFFYIC